MKRSFIIIMMIVFTVFLWSEDVVFNVNMTYQVTLGNFDPEVDFVDVAGTMNGWNGSGAMADPEEDGIYTVTYPDLTVGTVCEYKFRINGDWSTSEFPGGGANRTYIVVAGENIVDHWYNDQQPATVFADVVFMVTDGTENYLDIKFKSSFDEWVLHPMADDGIAPDETAGDHIWSVLVTDIPNGTWEWGAIEDDGSQWGIWLIEGPNLQFTIDEEGNVTGQTDYFVDPGSMQDVTVTFQLDTSMQTNIGVITVAGDFNAWNGTSDELVWDEIDGLWKLEKLFPIGSQISQEYKYLNDGAYEDIENRIFILDDTVTEQILPVDYYNNVNPADYLTQSMVLTINVDMEDTVFDSLAVCGSVLPLDWAFGDHNHPLELLEGTIWTIDVSFEAGAYRYLDFKFALDGQDLEAGFNENHTCMLDESEMSQTVWCVYGVMGPTTGNDENGMIPSGYSLKNYPNPFNPETTIVYQLPADVKGELVICNIKGQQVKSWENLSGHGSLFWDGKTETGVTAASGLYLAIIKAGNFTQSEKMILLK
ncbi:MAG: T9SS type A sorting domain-containing protein [Candidatus Cloacimonetes bacterium]|nr:T9SS type A sorting domain-containing protein [Candidatus Cloacimonadota bacterium]